jgi:hypothetical protein
VLVALDATVLCNALLKPSEPDFDVLRMARPAPR